MKTSILGLKKIINSLEQSKNINEQINIYEYYIYESMRIIESMNKKIERLEKTLSTKKERYFCERCGKRLGDGIHTCTPPMED